MTTNETLVLSTKPNKETVEALIRRLEKDVKVLSEFKATERFGLEVKELLPGLDFLRELLRTL